MIRRNLRKILTAAFFIGAGLFLSLYLANFLYILLMNNAVDAFANQEYILPTELLSPIECIKTVIEVEKVRNLFYVFSFASIALNMLLLMSMFRRYKSPVVKVTDYISIPAPAGQGQHGSATFMNDKTFKKTFQKNVIHKDHPVIQMLIDGGETDRKQIKENALNPLDTKPLELSKNNNVFKNSGMVLGLGKKHFGNNTETIYYLDHDYHFFCVGATRAGKDRSIILQTIGHLGLCGESMLISDVKGEDYDYTYRFLTRLGYDVFALDFKNPELSAHYNYLQDIIDAVNDDNMDKAIERTWDIVEQLVERKDTSEPIWANGEAATIGAAILSVVYDCQDYPAYQSLGNVFHFLSVMCRSVPGADLKPFDLYIEDLRKRDPEHPVIVLSAISDVAPYRTKGSFYASALTTLRLFTIPSIARMTSSTDFRIRNGGTKKQAVFIILPDQKETYYSLATLFVSQEYDAYIMAAEEEGGRLPLRTFFIGNEFGNFSKIKNIEQIFTAGLARGFLFSIYLQDFRQLYSRYDRDVAGIIDSNCEVWMYLQSANNDTIDTFVKKLGKYTTTSHSTTNDYRDYIYGGSENISLIGRDLLTSSEIKQLNRPDSLLITQDGPKIMYTPDIATCSFNTMFGMGDKDHNIALRKQCLKTRRKNAERNKSNQRLFYDGWDYYRTKLENLAEVEDVNI